MAKSDSIRKIAALFRGLDDLAADFDRLDAMEQREKEHAKAIASHKADADSAKAEIAKAKEDAAKIRAEAKAKADTIVDHANANAATVVSAAIAKAAKSEEDIKTAVAKLEDLNARAKIAADLLAATADRVLAAEKQEADLMAKVEKAKAALRALA